MAKLKWKTQREAFIEALHYVKGRQQEIITSIKTPWESLNNATTNGIEWHSTTVIGARPATGKTLIKDILVTQAFKLNPLMKFRALEFQFEMLGKNSAIREFSGHLGKSYKYLCSATGDKISDEEIELCRVYAKEKLKYPIDIVETPCNTIEFNEIIESYMLMHATKEIVKKRYETDDGIEERDVEQLVYTPTIITLDHSLLLTKAPFEKDSYDTLYSLGRSVTALKRKFPIAFIILSQLNRDIDKPERNEDGKYGNFILESDLFGADALLQHADTLIGLNRPGKQQINYYGVQRYMVMKDPTILAMHYLKCRNGETGVSFFRTRFEEMALDQLPPLDKHVRGLRT